MDHELRERATVLRSLASDPPRSIASKRCAVDRLRGIGYGVVDACRLIGLATSTYYHATRARAPVQERDAALGPRLVALRRAEPRAGYRRLAEALRAQGLAVNHKRVYRLCKHLGLLRRRLREVSETSPGLASPRWPRPSRGGVAGDRA